MILIDTNIFIDHLRGYVPATKFFESILDNDNVFFSAITESELIAGKECDNAGKRELLLHFLSRWEKIVVSNKVALLAGDISRNFGLSIPDALIASSAILTGSELLTKNTKDFKRVEGLKLKEPY